jgi:hypothetical protein
MTEVPAFVRNGRLDVLAVNALGAALYAPVFDGTPADRVPNVARFNFLDPRARDFWPDWNRRRRHGGPAAHRGRARPLRQRLVGSGRGAVHRSEDFRVRWAEHQVRLHRTGLKHFRHPVVGELHLSFDAMQLPTETGLTLTAFTAEAGSPSGDALRLLASWAASREVTDASH